MAMIVCLGILGFAGIARALTFTDTQTLNVIIGEGPGAQLLWGDSYFYTHATPSDFEVPWDIVNSATLDISGYLIDDNNDQVQISGSAVGTLTPGGEYGCEWDWSSFSWVWFATPSISTFDISSTFSSWSTGDPLGITITANGAFLDGIIQLETSTFSLDYNNDTAPVPEPATILLLGTGLLGIIGFSRKRMNKKAQQA